MIISLDMYQTLFAAVCVLMLGRFLKARIGFLEKFCIPAPVIGGVLFAIFTCICYVTGVAEFAFDDTLKEVCMVMFFTSVGFQANLKVLKSGGKSLLLFLGLVVALILCQNFLAVGLADLLGISPLIGLWTRWWAFAPAPSPWWAATAPPVPLARCWRTLASRVPPPCAPPPPPTA